MQQLYPIVLASASKARAALLQQAGFIFTVDPADIDESRYQADSAEELVKILALEKAKVTAVRHPQAWVLAADTIIVDKVDGAEIIHGKPHDATHAVTMLRALSGHAHRVMTGLCLYVPSSQRFLVESETTLVTFHALDDEMIKRYVETGEPLGKAGGYAIQGKGHELICDVSGNVDNVVGLPIQLFTKLLLST
jgi:septum formation protein